MKYLTIAIAVLVILVCAFFVMCPVQYVDSKLAYSFTVNQPVDLTIRKIALRNALEEIVAANNGRVLEKHWDYLNVGITQLQTQGLQVEGTCRFRVENHGYAGDVILEFSQTVHVASRDHMDVDSNLLYPVAGIKVYRTTIHFEKDTDTTTKVQVNNQIIYERHIPRYMHISAEKSVKESQRTSMENTERIIRSIAEAPGPAITIPLKKLTEFYEDRVLQHGGGGSGTR